VSVALALQIRAEFTTERAAAPAAAAASTHSGPAITDGSRQATRTDERRRSRQARTALRRPMLNKRHPSATETDTRL